MKHWIGGIFKNIENYCETLIPINIILVVPQIDFKEIFASGNGNYANEIGVIFGSNFPYSHLFLFLIMINSNKYIRDNC